MSARAASRCAATVGSLPSRASRIRSNWACTALPSRGVGLVVDAVRQRCQEAPGRVAASTATSPAWASLVTSHTPVSPRATRSRKSPSQPAAPPHQHRQRMPDAGWRRSARCPSDHDGTPPVPRLPQGGRSNILPSRRSGRAPSTDHRHVRRRLSPGRSTEVAPCHEVRDAMS